MYLKWWKVSEYIYWSTILNFEVLVLYLSFFLFMPLSSSTLQMWRFDVFLLIFLFVILLRFVKVSLWALGYCDHCLWFRHFPDYTYTLYFSSSSGVFVQCDICTFTLLRIWMLPPSLTFTNKYLVKKQQIKHLSSDYAARGDFEFISHQQLWAECTVARCAA